MRIDLEGDFLLFFGQFGAGGSGESEGEEEEGTRGA